MYSSLIKKAFYKSKSENRPALITYTVAGDSTKKKIHRNFKINF